MSREIKKVVLTGATGMIGVTLINHLLQQNIEVSVIIRPNSKKRSQLPKSEKLKVIEIDLANISKAVDFLDDKYDAFYHLGWDGTYGEVVMICILRI